jgi:hypothetical protein
MKAICQICGEVFAEVDLNTLRYPVTGAMFNSPDVPHGYPAPFDSWFKPMTGARQPSYPTAER